MGDRSVAARYGVATAAVVIAVGARLSLDPLWGTSLPLITFFPAIMASAWFGGFGPGIVTTLLSAVAANYVWMEPRFPVYVTDAREAVALVMFLVVGLFMSAVTEGFHRGRQRQADALKQEQAAAAAIAASEERLKVTIASIGDAVIATDADGRVTLLNPIAEALTGWNTAEASGKPLMDVFAIIDERSREAADNPVERALREGVITGLANHTVLLSRDGREIPIDDSAAPIKAADGHVVGAVMVFRDVTARRRDETQLHVKHSLTLVLAESTTVQDAAPRILRVVCETLDWDAGGFWIVDRAAGVLRCVDAWHQPSVKAADFETVTRSQTFLPGVGLPGRIWARGESAWIRNLAEDDNFRRTTVAAKEGLHGAFGFAIVSGADVLGVVDFFSHQIREADASLLDLMTLFGSHIGQFIERKRAEEERAHLLVREQEARRDAERANRMKDEFLAMLSHELRTPLTSIVGWARMLRGAALDETTRVRALEVIERNAHVQTKLVDDMLDISRFMRGDIRLELRPLDLASLILAAVDAARGSADAKRLVLDHVIDPSVGPIAGDPDRLQQVVGNLLANAIKFTPAGGRVTILLERAAASARIVVTDTGEGIGAAFLPDVFETFRQGPEARKHGGLGLGLAIVRRLVELHGGTVRAESPGDGEGATFTVTLPLISHEV